MYKIVTSLSTGENDWEGQDNGEETSDQHSGGRLPSAETTGLLKTVSGRISQGKVSHQNSEWSYQSGKSILSKQWVVVSVRKKCLTKTSLWLNCRYLIKHEELISMKNQGNRGIECLPNIRNLQYLQQRWCCVRSLINIPVVFTCREQSDSAQGVPSKTMGVVTPSDNYSTNYSNNILINFNFVIENGKLASKTRYRYESQVHWHIVLHRIMIMLWKILQLKCWEMLPYCSPCMLF